MSRHPVSSTRTVPAPLIERLEQRRLMSFTPVISAIALTADSSTFGVTLVDPHLVNPQGLAVVNNGLFVANNLGGTVTSYNASGTPASLGVIPAVASTATGSPTGLVFHAGGGFDITVNGNSVPSSFIAATADGAIVGYSPAASSDAVIAVDHASTGDVFTGLAIVGSGRAARIYAADFHNDRIEVFNSKFQQLALPSAAFSDIQIPAGYAPFGVQAISGRLYVTYARQNATATADNPGPAQGIVNEFSVYGKKIKRIGTGGDLNSPYGVVQAPTTWGVYAGDLLVSNVGDGTISIFDRRDNFVGQVIDPSSQTGQPLSITGIWAMEKGTGKYRNTIFFTSAPNSRTDGITGTLTASR